YARAPGAATIRGELARSLLDLAGTSTAVRLQRIRELLARARELRTALAATAAASTVAPDDAAAAPPEGESGAAPDRAAEPTEGSARGTAVERRRDAVLLLDIWRDLARDLVLAGLGESASIHDPSLLEEIGALAAGLETADLGDFLHRLDSAGHALESNVGPELVA